MAIGGKTFLITVVILVALFLLGIFAFSSLLAPPAQNDTTNSTLLPLEINSSSENSTSENTTVKPDEQQPSFTGAIIVGITRPVAILRREGFSPLNISIKAGDSITWRNADPEQKKNVLIFQRGREQNKFFSSPALGPEEEWEHTFWEEGEYNYWTTAYGVKGKVTVTLCKNRFCPKKD